MKNAVATKKATANGNGGGSWIRDDKRLAIYLRDGFRCAYGLTPACEARNRDLSGQDARDITLDHLNAKHAAGSHHEGNLVTACRSCNSARQDTSLARFASPVIRADIRRLTRRSLAPYRRLAKQILAGELSYDAALEAR